MVHDGKEKYEGNHQIYGDMRQFNIGGSVFGMQNRGPEHYLCR